VCNCCWLAVFIVVVVLCVLLSSSMYLLYCVVLICYYSSVNFRVLEYRRLECKFIRSVHFYVIQVKFTLFDVPFNPTDVISKFLTAENLFSCDALHVPLFVQSVLKYSMEKEKCGRESIFMRQNHQTRNRRLGLPGGISFGWYRMV